MTDTHDSALTRETGSMMDASFDAQHALFCESPKDDDAFVTPEGTSTADASRKVRRISFYDAFVAPRAKHEDAFPKILMSFYGTTQGAACPREIPSMDTQPTVQKMSFYETATHHAHFLPLDIKNIDAPREARRLSFYGITHELLPATDNAGTWVTAKGVDLSPMTRKSFYGSQRFFAPEQTEPRHGDAAVAMRMSYYEIPHHTFSP